MLVNNDAEPKKMNPKMDRPDRTPQGQRVQTGLRAGNRAADGGVTHTDKWVQRW